MDEGNYSYNYDNIGNRKSAEEAMKELSYGTSNLNQYMSIQERKGETFTPAFDADGNQFTKLNNAGYCISEIEVSHGNDDIKCYLNDEVIDIQWFKMGNWREMMIYNLWTYGNGID